jgi:hypothetical protein
LFAALLHQFIELTAPMRVSESSADLAHCRIVEREKILTVKCDASFEPMRASMPPQSGP